VGIEQVRASGLLTAHHILQIQGELERNNAKCRKNTRFSSHAS